MSRKHTTNLRRAEFTVIELEIIANLTADEIETVEKYSKGDTFTTTLGNLRVIGHKARRAINDDSPTYQELADMLAENLRAWDDEEGSVKEEHAALIKKTRAMIKATEQP